MTEHLYISRRNLLAIGGAVTVGLLVRLSKLHAAPDKAAARMERELGKFKIKDVLHTMLEIEGEYACSLIKVTTDSGLYGIGEARPKRDRSEIVGKLKKRIIGKDPLRAEDLTRQMMAVKKNPGKGELGAIAGIETALWDLAGKILGKPVYELLGGKKIKGVPLYYDLSPSDTPKTMDPKPWIEWARHAKKSGYTSMKIDINRNGGSVPQWVKILEAIRSDIGPDMKIGVDFHWKLKPEQAAQFVQTVEPVNLWFVEDPMRYQDNEKHYQQLASNGKVPIMGGEQLLSLQRFKDVIDKRMFNLLEVDGQYVGGLLAFKQIVQLGEQHGLKTLCHNMCTPVGTFAQAHACVTFPSVVSLESPIAEQVIQHDGPMLEDGCLKLNGKPGFGIELNEDYCRKRLAEGSRFFTE